MTKLLGFMAVVASLVVSTAAQARDYIWYDAAQQAIAVDLRASERPNDIEIDFNGDHMIAAFAGSNSDTSSVGLRRIVLYEDSILHQFTLGAQLFDVDPPAAVSVLVTTLLDETTSPEKFYFFTPEWNPAAGKTVIYIQPATDTEGIPVTEDMLADVRVRLNEVEWQPVQASPLLEAPLPAGLTFVPRVWNARMHDTGPVIAKIDLPSPYTAGDVDLSTVVLSARETVAVEQLYLMSVHPDGELVHAGQSSTWLIGKFDRAGLLRWITTPDWPIFVVGRLHDGTPFSGSTTVTVLR